MFGVFLLTFSFLAFQIIQTRILSVIAWYYMAFFAISMAMLGMTVGAVWVYLHRQRLDAVPLSVTLANFALASAIAMPASIIIQFCLITKVGVFSLTVVVAWSLIVVAMAVPYVFSGVVVSLALTRSPFPTGQVYGVDLLGAALGCMGVLAILNLLDGPTAAIACGFVCGLSAIAFAASAVPKDRHLLVSKPWWRRPAPVTIALAAVAFLNSLTPVGIRPVLVKDGFETSAIGVFEKWNSYSRILATRPETIAPNLWALLPHCRRPCRSRSRL